MRTADEFQARAAVKGPETMYGYLFAWRPAICSKCGYPRGFMFNTLHDCVFHDFGCWCNKDVYIKFRVSAWQEVADYYNAQTDMAVIAEMDTFWGFEETTPMEHSGDSNARIIAYLREHGPTPLDELARVCDHSPAWLRRHLQKREGADYRRVYIDVGLQKWGLVEP